MTKSPDDGAVSVTVSVIGVLLMVLLIDPVLGGPIVVVSGSVDDVGWGDSVVVVIVVNSVTGSVQTYVTYILCKCLSHLYNDSLSFVNSSLLFSFIHCNTNDVLTFAYSTIVTLARKINYG